VLSRGSGIIDAPLDVSDDDDVRLSNLGATLKVPKSIRTQKVRVGA